MIPTCYLRQVGIYLTVPHQSEEDMCDTELTGYRLQQWWSNDGSGPGAPQGEIVPDPANRTMAYITVSRRGEWRYVEIVQ